MKNHKINITFDCFYVQKIAAVSIIKKCITTALAEQGVDAPCEINVLVTNDKGIHAINLASRNVDRPTDVLSFPMFTFEPGNFPTQWESYIDPETGMLPLGDIAISLERTTAQAKEFGHSPRRELGYLTIHSVLHLLGYDHMDEGPQKAQMREREDAIAAGIPRMQRD